MDKITEILMKKRLPVHPKCRGEGFTEEEKKAILLPYCSRIEPVEMPEKSFTDESCRCKAYVNPSQWWKLPTWKCPLADHYRPDLLIGKTNKGRVGQQKQKKKK